MDYFWIIVRCIEDLAVYLLLFALLTACVVRWRRKRLAIMAQAVFILCTTGFGVLAMVLGISENLSYYPLQYPHLMSLGTILGVSVVIHFISYIILARFGWRRCDPDAQRAAATWPRARLLLAFLVALTLNVVTHWNFTLSVRQRLAREEVEAGVMLLSAMPGRPIDSQNAAILYEPVFKRLPEYNHDHKLVQDDWLDFGKPLDTNDPKLRELLAKHRRDLDTLVRGSARSHCYFGIQLRPELGDVLSGRYTPLLKAADLLAVDTRRELVSGNLENAANNTTALFRLARHATQDPALIPVLVSVKIDERAAASLQALLNHPDLSTDILNRLQLEATLDYRRTLKRALTIEEARAITWVKRGSAEGFDFVTEEESNALGTFLWKATNPYFIEHELELLRSTYQEMGATLDHRWLEESAEAKYRTMVLRGICTRMFMAPLPQVMVRVMIGDARHRLCRLAIAVRRYELEHGELPETFDDLAPTYIEEIPLDPSTEKPFKMETVEGGVRLYSAEIESWDPEEYPGRAIKDTDRKVEMFLKSRKQADN